MLKLTPHHMNRLNKVVTLVEGFSPGILKIMSFRTLPPQVIKVRFPFLTHLTHSWSNHFPFMKCIAKDECFVRQSLMDMVVLVLTHSPPDPVPPYWIRPHSGFYCSFMDALIESP
eukprot:Gb_19280 [translate_table: standard]